MPSSICYCLLDSDTFLQRFSDSKSPCLMSDCTDLVTLTESLASLSLVCLSVFCGGFSPLLLSASSMFVRSNADAYICLTSGTEALAPRHRIGTKRLNVTGHFPLWIQSRWNCTAIPSGAHLCLSPPLPLRHLPRCPPKEKRINISMVKQIHSDDRLVK